MHVHDHLPLEELQRLAKAITEKRVWLRYQAVILANQGRSAAAVARPSAAASAPSRPGSPATTGAAPRPCASGPTPAARRAWPGRNWSASAAARGRAHARGRRLHLLRPRPPADPRAGVRRAPEPPGRLRPAASPRLQQPDAPAPAQGRRRGGAGDLQGGRRRPDPGHRRGPSRRGGPGLVRGRGPLRPAGDDHAGLGPQGLAAAGACGRPRTPTCTC